MIERLQRIATRLASIKPLLLLLGFLSLAAMLASGLDPAWIDGERYLIPSIIVFCWAGALYAIAELFLHVPPILPRSEPWRARLSVRLRRTGLWLLAGLMVILSLALVYLTWQLIRSQM